MMLNSENDLPVIIMETIWEMDIIGDFKEHDRMFYPERKWWQLRKKTREQSRLINLLSNL